MTDSADLLLWLLRTTLALSATAVLALLLRSAVRRWLGASAAWRLWFALPAAWWSVQLPVVQEHSPLHMLTPLTLSMPLMWEVPSGTAGSTVCRLILLVWMAGVLLTALWELHCQRRFVRSLGQLRPLGDGVWLGRDVPGLPALVGLWRPRIVIPQGFSDHYNRQEQELVLLHERIHRQRGDVWINALLAVMTCLYWFNPLIWRAARACRMDQELSCDERVIACSQGTRRSYGQALFKACAPAWLSPAGCHWHATSHPLHERIRLLKRPVAGAGQTAVSWAVAGLLVALTSLVSFQGRNLVEKASPVAELARLAELAALAGAEEEPHHPTTAFDADGSGGIGLEDSPAISVAALLSYQGAAAFAGLERGHFHRCAGDSGRPGRRI